VLTGHSGGLKPELLRQSGMFAMSSAPLVEPATRCGQGEGNWCLLSGAHQLVLRKIGFAGPPGDPSDEPPIKRKLLATTDDTSQNQSFHAPLPKGHFAGTPKGRRLYQLLLSWIARDILPCRPNRVEPRAVKRRPKEYPLLNRPRNEMRKALLGA
jgi:hypothetical protein